MEQQIVQIVTIKNKTPLFKGEEQANAIEKIELEENGFSLVAQKDLYKIGDKAVYIQPDYCLSDIPLFESFIRPGGDPKKSKLGSNNRIRAVKFNLHTGDNEPVYSVGILLPYHEVYDLLPYDGFSYNKEGSLEETNLVELLGITKWEEPEPTIPGGKQSGGRNFPENVYKTDETNINNLWNHLENKIGYPCVLIGSVKVDGSSISIFCDEVSDEYAVGSRNLIKPEKINKTVGYRQPTLWERLKKFFTGYMPDLRIRELVENDDKFIQLAKPYIEAIRSKSASLGMPMSKFILRGEAYGAGWKGSGNKNNPHSKLEPGILFFGVDGYDQNNVAYKLDDDWFRSYMDFLGFESTPVVFDKIFYSREEIEKECKEYFKNNMVEGIVLRTPDSKFSAKFMNDEYDSKK